MHAVEKISSYFTRGVYTVSAPFHPFGGAVDIIVVQQEDGSYKSSPWYVRFGKFQGVLKAKEKVVNICVNGVEAGFHMYLDHTGEAFFMKEGDSAEEGEFVISSPPSSGDEVDDKMEPMVFQKEVTSCDYDAERKPIVTLENGNGQIVARTTSRRSQILGLMFGRKSVKETVESGEVQRVNSMECAQIAADLLESRWPTGSPMSYKEGTETSKEESVCVCGENLEGTPKHNIVRGVHFEETVTNTYTLETCDVGDSSKVITESVITSEECCLSTKASILNNFIQDAKVLGSCELSDGREVTSFSHVETLESSPPISFDILTETHETLTSEHICEVTSKSELDQASDMEFSKVEDYSISTGQDDVNVDRSGCPGRVETAEDESRFQSLENLDKEQFPFDTDSFSIKDIKQEVSVTNPNCETDDIDEHDSENPNHEDCIERVAEVSVIHSIPLAIPRSKKHLGETEFLHANYGEIDLLAKSLPIIRSQVHDTEGSNLLHPLSCSLHFNSENTEKEISLALKLKKDAVEKQEISEAVDSENMGGYNASPIKSAVDLSLSKELQIEGTGADASSRVFDAEKENIYEPQGTIAIDHAEKNFNDSESSGPIAPSGGSWSIWPFSIKKSKTISTVRSPPESLTQEDNNVVVAPIRSQSLNDREDILEPTIRKQVRSLTPTSEELTSLNLNEGANVITFRFSTAMLGQQQVDARIYLWKWNTRIVISDVDGTITKSDVLGQFMPLVGKDWSQTGVAHLFSAIKENGYQLLFLSARSISQAYLTRQFLLTLKQDGKALPDGPVVISPDGLFPSLYREVIRRAPHEFKIKCLEDIKALFPSESGPFYAGFGNRDTDEISYLKVGVPKGKIFIINPKGEVAVNRRVNTKSYTSLHALVNGMFPPMSTVEQEDFNDLNFWKLPLPDINI